MKRKCPNSLLFVLLNFIINSRMDSEITEVDQDAMEVGILIT